MFLLLFLKKSGKVEESERGTLQSAQCLPWHRRSVHLVCRNSRISDRIVPFCLTGVVKGSKFEIETKRHPLLCKKYSSALANLGVPVD